MSSSEEKIKRRRRVRVRKQQPRETLTTGGRQQKPRDVQSVQRYKEIFEFASKFTVEDVRTILRLLHNHAGIDGTALEAILDGFDWSGAVQLLPALMEWAETLKNKSGAEKEKHTLAILLRIAQLAGVEEQFDEHAVDVLHIFIQQMIEVSKGEYKFNVGRFSRLIGSGAQWSLKHCPCLKK